MMNKLIGFNRGSGAPPVGPGASLVTSNLKFQVESDLPTFTATLWTEQIAGRNLTQNGGMVAPSVIAAGTPTGKDYMELSEYDGMFNNEFAEWEIPAGADARTMYAVMRFKSAWPASFQGIMFGTSTLRRAFGITISSSGKAAGDFWGTSIASTGNVNDDVWRVFTLTFDGTIATLYLNNSQVATGNPGVLNTARDKIYFNEALNNGTGKGFDVCAAHIYSEAHDVTKRTQMFDYLNDKYIGV